MSSLIIQPITRANLLPVLIVLQKYIQQMYGQVFFTFSNVSYTFYANIFIIVDIN